MRGKVGSIPIRSTTKQIMETNAEHNAKVNEDLISRISMAAVNQKLSDEDFRKFVIFQVSMSALAHNYPVEETPA